MLSRRGRFSIGSGRTLSGGSLRDSSSLTRVQQAQLSQVGIMLNIPSRVSTLETLTSTISNAMDGPRLVSALSGGSTLTSADVLQFETLLANPVLSVGATLHIGGSTYRVGALDASSLTITTTFAAHAAGSKIVVTHFDRLMTLAAAVDGGVQPPPVITMTWELVDPLIYTPARTSWYVGNSMTDWWRQFATHYAFYVDRPVDQYVIRGFETAAIANVLPTGSWVNVEKSPALGGTWVDGGGTYDHNNASDYTGMAVFHSHGSEGGTFPTVDMGVHSYLFAITVFQTGRYDAHADASWDPGYPFSTDPADSNYIGNYINFDLTDGAPRTWFKRATHAYDMAEYPIPPRLYGPRVGFMTFEGTDTLYPSHVHAWPTLFQAATRPLAGNTLTIGTAQYTIADAIEESADSDPERITITGTFGTHAIGEPMSVS